MSHVPELPSKFITQTWVPSEEDSGKLAPAARCTLGLSIEPTPPALCPRFSHGPPS